MNILQIVLLIMTIVLLCYSNTGVLSLRGNSLDRVLRYHLPTSKCKSLCLLRHTLSQEIESCWDRCSSNYVMEDDRIENNSGNFGRDNSRAPGWDIFPHPTPSNDCESIRWGELIPNYNYIGDMKERSIASALQQTHPANVYLIMGQDQKWRWHLLSSTWTKSTTYPNEDKRRLVLVVVDFFEGIKVKMRVPRCDEIRRRHPVKRSQFGMLKTSSHLDSSAMYVDHMSIPKNKLIFLSLMSLILTTCLVFAFKGLHKRCRTKNEGLNIPEII